MDETNYKFHIGDAVTIYGIFGTPFDGRVESRGICCGNPSYGVTYRDNHGRKVSLNITESLLAKYNP